MVSFSANPPAERLAAGGDHRAEARRVLEVERRLGVAGILAEDIGIRLDHAVEFADDGLPVAALLAQDPIRRVGGEQLRVGIGGDGRVVAVPVL
jgi:hypothetical protein